MELGDPKYVAKWEGADQGFCAEERELGGDVLAALLVCAADFAIVEDETDCKGTRG